MITMEDAIKGLLEQGLVDEEEARTALLKSSDSGEDDESTKVAGAPSVGARAAADRKNNAKAGGKAESEGEEGYSF